MKRARVLYYAVMAVCLVAALYTGRRAYYLVFFAQLFTLACMMAVNLWTAYAFTFRQELSARVCVKGEEVLLRVQIKNERPVPLSLMEVHVDAVSPRENSNLVFSLAPHSGREFEIPVAAAYRGSYRVGMTTIRITDVLGLTSFRLDMRRLSYYRLVELLILPRAQAPGRVIAEPTDAKFFGSRFMRQASAGDSVTGAALYHEGDELRRVHWKKSMQQGELYVKQYDHPEQERVLILIDTSLHGLTGEEALIHADTVCECAASIALLSFLRGKDARVMASSGQGGRADFARSAGVEQLQRYLALLAFREEGSLLNALRNACAAPGSARALFVLTRDASAELLDALEGALTQFRTVTLVLSGGAKIGGRVHTLYVEDGCDAAAYLDGIA